MRNDRDEDVSSTFKSDKTSLKTNRKPRGRPQYFATAEHRSTVLALAACGYPQILISSYLKVDPRTLAKHYQHELRTARMSLLAKATSNVGKSLSSPNEDRALKAAMYVLNTLGKDFGWSFGPQKIYDPFQGVDFSVLSSTELDLIINIFEKLGVKPSRPSDESSEPICNNK